MIRGGKLALGSGDRNLQEKWWAVKVAHLTISLQQQNVSVRVESNTLRKYALCNSWEKPKKMIL